MKPTPRPRTTCMPPECHLHTSLPRTRLGVGHIQLVRSPAVAETVCRKLGRLTQLPDEKSDERKKVPVRAQASLAPIRSCYDFSLSDSHFKFVLLDLLSGNSDRTLTHPALADRLVTGRRLLSILADSRTASLLHVGHESSQSTAKRKSGRHAATRAASHFGMTARAFEACSMAISDQYRMTRLA